MSQVTPEAGTVLAQWRALLSGTGPLRIEFEYALSMGRHKNQMVHTARLYTRRGRGWVKVGPTLFPPEADPTRAGLLAVLSGLSCEETEERHDALQP